ncbi:MAG: hypothetical protein HYY43_04335 [Deltaproteobacteria bacterium]|nr:hypothetical protein [Deltaproteobacteria bacterium]
MYAGRDRHTRTEIVKMLIQSFQCADISIFGPKNEEEACKSASGNGLTKEECLSTIKEELLFQKEELSNLSEIHPAWIVKALENESPKIIGIILRWLPSKHVRYILENIPKRVKMSLPKLIESFAVPAPILNLIKSGFERKFKLPASKKGSEIKTFDDSAYLSSEALPMLFCDLGLHELAFAFQNVDESGIRVLLNRMAVSSARALQQRMKDVKGINQALLKDARYSILEVALDQEDIDKLLVEIGLIAFAKAVKDTGIFSAIQMKLDPIVSYKLKRYIDQQAGAGKLAAERQKIIMERIALLARAEEI